MASLPLVDMNLQHYTWPDIFAGFERLPPGANPLDPHWVELQRRYAHLPPGTPGAPHPSSHIPGVYPPANLASDLLQRERERLERLGRGRAVARGPCVVWMDSSQQSGLLYAEAKHHSYSQIWSDI